MPPVVEPLQIFARIPHSVGQGPVTERLVGPKMEALLDAKFLGQFVNSV
jgi:hypothetical protein